MKSKLLFLGLAIVAAFVSGGMMIVTAQAPVGTAFTYQGQLKSGGALVNGNCDFNFGLWDSIGAQKGVTQTLANIAVTNGLFNVQLNGSGQFGVLAFDGNARYLGIAVACPTGSLVTTTLSPREQLTAAPYAQYAVNAASAVTANSVLTPTLRRYYMTTASYDGSHTLSACAVGYHFASLWEIFNTSSLLYNTSLGVTLGDSGSGPPGPVVGWARTGTGSASNNTPGATNCNAWTTNSSSFTGTVVSLEPGWIFQDTGTGGYYPISPWFAFPNNCSIPRPVYCVQDLP